jgi:predicted GNAT family acetyltransferase
MNDCASDFREPVLVLHGGKDYFNTDADVRGLGLATALVHQVADGILDRGETPYLNVADGNDNARALYERLGFRLRRTIAFRSVRWQ